MNSPHPASRRMSALVALLSVLGLALLTASPAAAANCGKPVVNDWYDNGRVDKIYPLRCYRDAIRILPTDVIDYSNAKEEIGRALAFARQGKPDPGSTPTTTTETTPGKTRPGKTTPGKTTPTDTTPVYTTPQTDTTPITDASPVDSSKASSVPLPLIVLGGLALLLLAAGSAGYLTRRFNARRGGGDGTPPASA